MKQDAKMWDLRNAGGDIGLRRAEMLADLAPPGVDPWSFGLLTEERRLDLVRAQGAVPERCGPAYPVAPARGAFHVETMKAMVPGTQQSYRTGHYERGEVGPRDTVRIADAFDVMEAQARRAAAERGRYFDPPFTETQKAMGRLYGGLALRVQIAGLSCSSIEGRSGSGGSGQVSEARLDDINRLIVLQRRVGPAMALSVRRARRKVGIGRQAVPALAVVDMVCRDGATLDDVLRRYGWSGHGDIRRSLRLGLASALDRMCSGSGERKQAHIT